MAWNCILRHSEWWDEKSSRSQWPDLNDINLRGVSGIGGHIQVLEIIAGDNEDDGGGAEGHPLFGSVPGAAGAGHDNRPNGALDRSQGALFEAVLQPRKT